MPTLLVVDDHQVAISGIRHALAGLPDFTIIAQTANGYEALQVLETTSPDMVITDLYLGDETLGGIELAEIIRQKYPSIRTLMFSSETRKSQVLRRAYQAGIAGYVPKTAPLQELVLALTAIGQGKTYFSPDILEKIVDTLNVKTDLLTPTEKRILDLLAQGKSRKEITQQILNRSGNTYDTHFQSIKRKLEVKTTPELITKAIRMGLLAVDEP